MLYPISSAIELLKEVGKCRQKLMVSFVATRHNIKIEKEGDFNLEENAFACWYGQLFFKMWLGDEFQEKRNEMNELNDVNEIIKIISENGVYYIDFTGSESHHFVLVTFQNSVWYAGTYGGINLITVKEFEKEDFLLAFQKAFSQNSIEEYGYLFSVQPFQKTVGFEFMNITKSLKYN